MTTESLQTQMKYLIRDARRQLIMLQSSAEPL